jgi:VanZ family protein
MNPAGPDTEVVTHVVTDFRLAQARESRLAWYFAGAYLLVIVYASLSPFSGWATPGVPPLAFLDEPWPRRWQRFDLLINGAAYLPLGLLLTLATMRWIRPLLAVLLATLAGSALSFGLETAQMYLPGRVASSVDLILNTVGTLLGALLDHPGQTAAFVGGQRCTKKRLEPLARQCQGVANEVDRLIEWIEETLSVRQVGVTELAHGVAQPVTKGDQLGRGNLGVVHGDCMLTR